MLEFKDNPVAVELFFFLYVNLFFCCFPKIGKDVFLLSILSNCSAEHAQVSGLILLRSEFDPSHVI